MSETKPVRPLPALLAPLCRRPAWIRRHRPQPRRLHWRPRGLRDLPLRRGGARAVRPVDLTTTQEIADKPPEPTPPIKDPKPKPEKPAPHKPDAKPADHTSEANTPYDDPATVDQPPGDPFSSPDGWSDMAKDGDPWATAVLPALNGMTVGSYAGAGQDVSFKFQLIICADGKIDEVRTKQSTSKPDFDGQIRNALQVLKLPEAPPEIAKQLGSKCKKIPYEFTWSGKSSNGKVR